MNGGESMDGVVLYIFAGAAGVIALILMRCLVRLFMFKIGYDLSFARAISYIQEETDDYGSNKLDETIGKKSISLNMKARIVEIQALYIVVFTLMLLVAITLAKGNSLVRICLCAITIGLILSFIIIVLTEMRYRAEIIFLEECGDGHVKFRKVISDDDSMIGEELQTSLDATELRQYFEQNVLVMVLEMPDGDIMYDRIWN